MLNPSQKELQNKEDIKDQQQLAELKQIGRDVLFSVSCRVDGTKDSHQITKIQHDMAHLFDKFLHQGSIKLSGKKQQVRANRNAFINMFHLPTKEYTNNALKYITYRKLPAPMHVPLPTELGITIL